MRLFTGIDLPPEVLLRMERLISALRPEALINWSPLDNLHVTTKFIGEWPEKRLDEVRDALSAVRPRTPFNIEIRDLGWFPHERSPRVLWAGIYGGEPLRSLAAEIDSILESRLGMKREEREFAPHLTLARIKSPVPLQHLRQKVAEMRTASFATFSASHFLLYRSQPGSNASIYHKLQEYRFEPALAAGTI